jgi:hypothetical protein
MKGNHFDTIPEIAAQRKMISRVASEVGRIVETSKGRKGV